MGEGSAPRRTARRFSGRRSGVHVRRWATNGLGVESCGEGVDASREFWRDAGGRFLERGATLAASSQSMSCTEPFWLVTLGCGSGRRMEGEPKGAASRQKRLEAPARRGGRPGLGALGAPAGGRARARGHTYSGLLGPPAYRPAIMPLRGSGRQRGGVTGLDADSGIVPCVGPLRRLYALARSACWSPRGPGTSAAPKKLRGESSRG